ncbi:response regulator transcription factor [Anaerobacillus sp. HL2]|nr:response regulator transcription factor [Anaerobacillus sp. HL2]
MQKQSPIKINQILKAKKIYFSSREKEVLKLIALGYTQKENIKLNHISIKTVRYYKTRIMEKLGIKKNLTL